MPRVSKKPKLLVSIRTPIRVHRATESSGSSDQEFVSLFPGQHVRRPDAIRGTRENAASHATNGALAATLTPSQAGDDPLWHVTTGRIVVEAACFILSQAHDELFWHAFDGHGIGASLGSFPLLPLAPRFAEALPWAVSIMAPPAENAISALTACEIRARGAVPSSVLECPDGTVGGAAGRSVPWAPDAPQQLCDIFEPGRDPGRADAGPHACEDCMALTGHLHANSWFRHAWRGFLRPQCSDA
eukprot:CAMPEP_0179359932 /NCGR_PEP_ID=MMETSP0797-20121207/79706_1 /TAXON_ID=47934 /ORGANISM="Dinophysis acuminata, Strain DAEP01" /LENGTH=243 /DNA_ID=CAMNT_0021075251 /DNA_START=268 /DNA_END=999 /DNA_ORIENTATION=+